MNRQYTFKEKIYEWSMKLDAIGGGSPNSNIGKTENIDSLHSFTTIKESNKKLANNLSDNNKVVIYRLKSQLMSILAFCLFVAVIYHYQEILDLKFGRHNANDHLSLSNGTISMLFTTVFAPTLIVIGSFAHFDMIVWDGGKSKITNDETMSQANLYERIGFCALLVNVFVGGSDASVLVNLYYFEQTLSGIIFLIISWLCFLYLIYVITSRLRRLGH